MQRRRFLGLLGTTTVGTFGAAAAGAGTACAASGGYEVERTDPVEVESFDGTTIVATAFEPASPGRYPAVLATHGWGGSRDQNFGEGRAYASDGYVVLTYDSRGFGESEGEVGVDGPREVRDVGALLDWLADHPKVRLDVAGDPRVGTFGGSYAGGIQLNAAAEDDRIDALVPEICWHDLNDALQPNGVVKLAWGAGLYAVGVGGSRQHEAQTGDVRGLDEGVDADLHRSFAEGVVRNGYSEESEAYFARRSPRYDLAAVDAPTLLVQGWTDHLFVPNEAVRNFEGLREAGVETRLLLYRDGHEQLPVDGEYAQRTTISDAARKAWLDAHLKEGPERRAARDRLRDLLPDAVTFYANQDGTFRSVDAMPPSTSRRVAVALGEATNAAGDRSVVANAPAGSNSYVVAEGYDAPAASVDFDFPAERFGAAPGAPADLLGAPTLDLRVRPLGEEAFLFFKPKRVAANGTVTHVDDQVTPIRVSTGVEGVGDPREVAVELIAFQRYLRAGDRLRLTVAGTDTGFNISRRAAGAVVSHDSTLSVPVTE